MGNFKFEKQINEFNSSNTSVAFQSDVCKFITLLDRCQGSQTNEMYNSMHTSIDETMIHNNAIADTGLH